MGMSEAGSWTGKGLMVGWQSDRLMIMGFMKKEQRRDTQQSMITHFPETLPLKFWVKLTQPMQITQISKYFLTKDAAVL